MLWLSAFMVFFASINRAVVSSPKTTNASNGSNHCRLVEEMLADAGNSPAP
jgi:hypothetical protein